MTSIIIFVGRIYTEREREREREREGGKLLIFIYDRNHRVVRDVGARARARIYV